MASNYAANGITEGIMSSMSGIFGNTVKGLAMSTLPMGIVAQGKDPEMDAKVKQLAG